MIDELAEVGVARGNLRVVRSDTTARIVGLPTVRVGRWWRWRRRLVHAVCQLTQSRVVARTRWQLRKHAAESALSKYRPRGIAAARFSVRALRNLVHRYRPRC